MADEVDLLQERDAPLMEHLLRQRKPTPGEPTGFCLNCDEPVQIPARYCDGDCREDHERLTFMASQKIT